MHLDMPSSLYFFFFFNDTATTEIYTLSLHDALPISFTWVRKRFCSSVQCAQTHLFRSLSRSDKCDCSGEDRKSTRLNSSHLVISYAVFCLKKKIGRKSLAASGLLGAAAAGAAVTTPA